MSRIYLGASVFMLGIVGFILDTRYRPNPARELFIAEGSVHPRFREGVSPTVYDLVHVASWALVVAGAVLVATGLIAFNASLRRST